MKTGNRVGLVVVGLFFGLPFAAAGVFAMVTAFAALRAGIWNQAIPSALAGLVACAIGFGLLAVVFVRWKPQAQGDRLRAANPEKPWLWRKDWAEGRVSDSTASTMWFLWIAAFCFNLIFGLPLAILILWDVFSRHHYPALIALIFPAIGIGLLAWAMRATVRRRKFGTSIFAISTVPGTVGGSVAGRIEFQKPLPGDIEFTVCLRCVRRVTKTRANNSRFTSDTDLWQEEKKAKLDANANLPIRFDIPASARETDAHNPRNQIVWLLEAEAPTPDVAYVARFELPVFKNTETGQR